MMLETSHGVLGRGRESNCKHDQQNNILHEQILFKCKLPKVNFFLVEFLVAWCGKTEVFFSSCLNM